MVRNARQCRDGPSRSRSDERSAAPISRPNRRRAPAVAPARTRPPERCPDDAETACNLPHQLHPVQSPSEQMREAGSAGLRRLRRLRPCPTFLTRSHINPPIARRPARRPRNPAGPRVSSSLAPESPVAGPRISGRWPQNPFWGPPRGGFPSSFHRMRNGFRQTRWPGTDCGPSGQLDRQVSAACGGSDRALPFSLAHTSIHQSLAGRQIELDPPDHPRPIRRPPPVHPNRQPRLSPGARGIVHDIQVMAAIP